MEVERRKRSYWVLQCLSPVSQQFGGRSCREWIVSKWLQVLGVGWVLAAGEAASGRCLLSVPLGLALLPGTIKALLHSIQQGYEVGGIHPFANAELRVREVK